MLKKIWYRVVILLTLIVLCGNLIGCENSSGVNENKSHSVVNQQKNNLKTKTGTMEVHFIDVGQGDCTLITCDEHAMLIDAGNNSRGTAVQMYLTKKGITVLDYVIGTHPDADHIGGLDVILYKFDCKQVILPDYSKETETYDDVIQTINQKREKITKPVVGESYQLGSAQFTIIAPGKTKYDNANDYSVGILLVHGEKRFVLTGDAEGTAEQDMLSSGIDLSADVYKASHHGSKTGSSKEFLDAVNPEYAVISCGEGNSYGHPHAETLNNFRQRGIKVFRTDEQGSIIAVSDGKTITWNCSPSDSWKAGEPIAPVTNESNSKYKSNGNALENKTEKVTYIINSNTKKFHLPSCSSVADMSEDNKEKSDLTKKELIEEGYSPCKRCIVE